MKIGFWELLSMFGTEIKFGLSEPSVKGWNFKNSRKKPKTKLKKIKKFKNGKMAQKGFR